MREKKSINMPADKVAEFCKRNGIRKLSLFGSALRDDFRPDSDIDVLVEFEYGHTPGLMTLAALEMELSELFGGYKVEINTPTMLSPYFRDEVVDEAQIVYVQT